LENIIDHGNICCYEFVSADFNTLVLFLLDYITFTLILFILFVLLIFLFTKRNNLSIFGARLGFD